MPILLFAFLGAILFITIAYKALQASVPESKTPVVKAPAAEQDSAPVQMVNVPVPIRDIDPGAVLNPAMFTFAKKPKITLSQNTVVDFNQLREKYARTMLPAYHPVLSDWLTSKRPMNAVVANIPEGFRAVTISVNATSSVEGWARAGAKVDVHWITGVLGQPAAKLLVENAKILSAERQLEANPDPNVPIPTTVTLLVTQKDAQKISLASTAGQLVLHLRGFADKGKGAGEISTLKIKELAGASAKRGEEALEGYVRFRRDDGKVEEWALVNGRLMRRKK